MAADDWAKQLSQGSLVGITNHRRSLVKFATVDYVTPTGQIVIGEQRFKANRFGGVLEVGGGKFASELLSKDEAHKLNIQVEQNKARRNRIKALRDKDWSKLNDDQLQQVETLILSFSASSN